MSWIDAIGEIEALLSLSSFAFEHPMFTMPEVIDGASDFFYELLGPKNGQHARTAVGLAELPHGIPVEINGEFELHS